MLFFSNISKQSAPLVLSDETLASQVQREPHIFGQLYERHTNRVYAYCLARTGSVEDAQDLTSDIFLAALENLARYDSRRSFAGWLYGIAHHKVVDYYRRRPASTPLEAIEKIADPAASTEARVEKRIRMQAVARSLQTLNHEQAEALTLRIFAGLSTAETGLVMGKSEAAIKMLVYRALQNLQERLSPEMEEIA